MSIVAFSVLSEEVLDLLRHRRRPRLGGPRGQDELELGDALVLVGQEAGRQPQEADHQHRDDDPIGDKEQDRRGDDPADGVAVAVGGAVEPAVEAVAEAADEARLLVGIGAFEQVGGERRRQDQRDGDGQDHRRDDGDGELAVDDADRAAKEGHRQEHRRQHHGDADQRALDLTHRLDRRVARADVGLLLEHALDVLDDDDGVVDEKADRQHQPEQRQRVDRVAEGSKDAERAEQDDRHGDRRDQRRPPALQEDEHDDDDEDDRLAEGDDHLADRQLDEGRAVERKGVSVARRERLRRVRDRCLDQLGGLQRVWPGASWIAMPTAGWPFRRPVLV